MRVDLHDIVKRYGSTTALWVENWTADEGEIVGLVGSNGAGKTTFLRLILDLLKPDTGRVDIDGHSVAKNEAWKARTGSFLDASFLIDFLTAAEYFRFVGSIYGHRNGDTRKAVRPYRDLLPFLEKGHEPKLIREMSTGNAKKVGIVAALFVRPDLLILDEPFANLDPPSQIQLKQHLTRMAGKKRMTMIISSHDLGHVTDVCTRITVVDHGRIVRDEPKSDETLAELQEFFSGS
ncbi:MAG: ABC transporter ATP-binding protein [Bacteroidetes bacterium]|nr:ABC transporter ATP-binding protein [Bacteroidota bacterium]